MSSSAGETIIQIGMPDTTRKFNRVGEFGFNTCHAPTVLRKDVHDAMVKAHNELGMKYWRCHGTFGDDVGVYSRIARTNPDDEGYQFVFSGLKRIIDYALESGVRPFMEFSFMPEKLARDPSKKLLHYQACTSPPSDVAKWGEMIEATMRFFIDTYGLNEVRHWYFEVWNEPNLGTPETGGFFAGTQADYLELYRASALAVKQAHPALRIGGPATAKADWVSELCRFCKETNTPIDFVSTHMYPSDCAFWGDIGMEKRKDMQGLSPEERQRQWRLMTKRANNTACYEVFRKVRAQADAVFPGIPVFWSEWNAGSGWPLVAKDECNNAPFVASFLAGLARYSDGGLFWNLSDVWEEPDFHFEPFSGQFGMFSVDGIPKSAARGFQLFHWLETYEAPVESGQNDGVQGCIAAGSADGKRLTVLLWNHRDPSTDQHQNWDYQLRLPGKVNACESHTVQPGNGSAYETWLDMGEPINPTKDQFHALMKASEPLHVKHDPTREVAGTLLPGTLRFYNIEMSI